MNLVRLLTDTAARHPDRPALRLGGKVVTYARLARDSARAASYLLSYGLEPGDRVGLSLPNVPEFAVLYYGILRAGGVVVPMNPLLKEREREHLVADSRALITLDAARDWGAELAAHPPLETVAERAADDTAVLIYTSGTTGRPKGAELTHANLLRNVEATNASLLHLTEHDVLFGGLPLFHSFGQTCVLNTAVAAGASVTLLPRFDAGEALDLLVRDAVTVWAGVPTMFGALLGHPSLGPVHRGRLRLAASGGAALPVEVLHAFEEAFGCPLLEGYGLSETSPVASFNRLEGPRRPGTIGLPIAGVRIRIQDESGRELPDGRTGEVAVSGHNVMKGYWNRPEDTAEVLRDGWLRTGDLGVREADGLFRIVGRKKELIIRGGFNVYPREIEEVLYEHPAVAEAAVLGTPHPELGEEVTAVVALKPGRAAATAPDELLAFVKARVAPYKYPRVVAIADALPKGPTGKILKREITPPVLTPRGLKETVR
ncbi:long-chain fatty acid--CoA ligase [Streptomyces sp. N35]|uniref:long-chain-fatty-acid--CoA ligase n=1 Tax=Streptomyces sp. N35 TaxID=2795730 RepID=UPI0018F776E8|nr:long-chain fatty acid--CoA ligase [Streptomyces sp. N35]